MADKQFATSAALGRQKPKFNQTNVNRAEATTTSRQRTRDFPQAPYNANGDKINQMSQHFQEQPDCSEIARVTSVQFNVPWSNSNPYPSHVHAKTRKAGIASVASIWQHSAASDRKWLLCRFVPASSRTMLVFHGSSGHKNVHVIRSHMLLATMSDAGNHERQGEVVATGTAVTRHSWYRFYSFSTQAHDKRLTK
jgi:hypothetical protein